MIGILIIGLCFNSDDKLQAAKEKEALIEAYSAGSPAPKRRKVELGENFDINSPEKGLCKRCLNPPASS